MALIGPLIAWLCEGPTLIIPLQRSRFQSNPCSYPGTRHTEYKPSRIPHPFYSRQFFVLMLFHVNAAKILIDFLLLLFIDLFFSVDTLIDLRAALFTRKILKLSTYILKTSLTKIENQKQVRRNRELFFKKENSNSVKPIYFLLPHKLVWNLKNLYFTMQNPRWLKHE